MELFLTLQLYLITGKPSNKLFKNGKLFNLFQHPNKTLN